MAKKKRASRDLEILVAEIQAQLAPSAKVIHDVKLKGRQTGRRRQIDVLVKERIGQYEMHIAIECKDYNKPVDVKGVEEFYGLLTDVGAHKGVIVCPKGFTDTAKTRAQGWQIDLYSPVDTNPHKWQMRVTAPVVCDFRSAMFGIGLKATAHRSGLMKLPWPIDGLMTYNAHGVELGTPLDEAGRKWFGGEYPIEPGEHDNLPVFSSAPIFIDNGYGDRCSVEWCVGLHVERQLYFGHLGIDHLSGFKDELSGGVIMNAFTTGLFNPETVLNEWTPIASPKDLPTRPLMVLRGLFGMPLPGTASYEMQRKLAELNGSDAT